MAPVMDVASPYQSHYSWLVDDETGFMYQPDRFTGTYFTLQKKKEFVEIYRSCFPNLTEACSQAGISKMNYYNHMKLDRAFNKVISEIRDEKADTVESALFKVACMEKPAAFMDRIAFLRAYRPGLYLEKKINLTARDLDPLTLANKAGTLEHVVDGELVGSGSQDPNYALVQDNNALVQSRPVTVNQEVSTGLVQKETQDQ